MLTSWAINIFVSGLILRNGMGAENAKQCDHVPVPCP